MTIDVKEFNAYVSEFLGKSVQMNVSDTTKYQCVDWAKKFTYEFLKLGKEFGGPINKNNWAWGNAVQWATNSTALKYFTFIKNTPDLVPKAGDLCIWNNGDYGHIAVATGIGNTKRFCSIDQNVRGKYVSAEYHNYTNFLGVLRRK